MGVSQRRFHAAGMSTVTSRFSTIPSASVREQVQAGIADAVVASVEKIIENVALNMVFQSAPLSKPPISKGMTDTMETLKAIVLSPRVVAPEEYAQVSHGIYSPSNCANVFV